MVRADTLGTRGGDLGDGSPLHLSLCSSHGILLPGSVDFCMVRSNETTFVELSHQ